MGKKCWMRRIRIELLSKTNSDKIVLGDNKNELKKQFPELNNVNVYSSTKLCDDLNISITGSKYNATSKDKGTVTIYNLNYSTIVKIMCEEYYKIKIWAGYESQSDDELFQIFDGSVAYISNKIHSNHDTECYIIFASDVVAQYSQARMNFCLNSGINIYSALKYICMSSGIASPNIDPTLKNQFLTNVVSNYGTCATAIDGITQNCSATFSTDGIGNVIDITTTSKKRRIQLEKSDLVDGNPQMSGKELSITLLPTFDWKVGDILVLDNALINVAVSSADSVTSSFPSNYLDSSGNYMIIEMTYTIQNRGQSFNYSVKARSVSLISNITGNT